MKRITAFLVSILIFAAGLVSCGKTVEAKWQEQLDLGMRYLEEMDYENAILAFTKAIEVDPNRSEAYVERAKLYVQRGAEGDLALAAADYEKAIELGEETVDVFLALAAIYEEQGDLDKALAIIQQGYDLTGAPELYEKLQEMQETGEPEGAEPEGEAEASDPASQRQPLEGYPKTERRDNDDGSYWLYEYNEFGQLIQETYYLADDTLDRSYEHTYNEAGYRTREVYTNENPSDSGSASTVTNYSGDALERKLDETIYWVNGNTDHFAYDYQGLQVSISIRVEEADGTVFEAVVPYTMENEENQVSWGGAGWSSEGLRRLDVREYDSEGNEIKEVSLNPDGSIYEE